MEQLRDILYQRDLVISATGDLVQADYQTTVKQRVYARLITEPASLAHRPDFGVGIKSYQGRVASLGVQMELAKKIEEQISLDEDIESVDSVSFKDAGQGRFDINLKYRIKGGKLTTETFNPFGI